MIIKDLKDFNLQHIFECGQCFRWNCDETGVYTGIAGNYIITAKEENDTVIIDCDDEEFISKYFDLERDYSVLKNIFSEDEILNKACEIGYGIRLLKQDPFETVISFIISANNNIPRIKKIVESLCQNFGRKISDNYYSFPDVKTLAELSLDDLAVIKSGFRAKYILDAAKKVSSGELNLESIYGLSSDEGRALLKTVNGIGDKVADCILLFAYGKYDVFPKDVWIKRILNNLYKVEPENFDLFVKEKFGDFGGFAQQYLFYYGRELL